MDSKPTIEPGDAFELKASFDQRPLRFIVKFPGRFFSLGDLYDPKFDSTTYGTKVSTASLRKRWNAEA